MWEQQQQQWQGQFRGFESPRVHTRKNAAFKDEYWPEIRRTHGWRPWNIFKNSWTFSCTQVVTFLRKAREREFSFFFFFFSTLLLSSFWTSRGHRCHPFSSPVQATLDEKSTSQWDCWTLCAIKVEFKNQGEEVTTPTCDHGLSRSWKVEVCKMNKKRYSWAQRSGLVPSFLCVGNLGLDSLHIFFFQFSRTPSSLRGKKYRFFFFVYHVIRQVGCWYSSWGLPVL